MQNNISLQNRNVRIVADSAADILALRHIPFVSVPLKIITDQKEYVDNDRLSVERMVGDLKVYKGRSSTSCPNTEDWLAAFGDAPEVYCVTITGTLSGSYNAALTAKQIYEEAHPDRRVFVFNTLTAAAEIRLIIEKIEELLLEGMDFDGICQSIPAYKQRTGLMFMLASMRNFANNGRVSPAVAKFAGLMGIRVVGKASDEGTLEAMHKCRGEKSALVQLYATMKELGFCGGKVRITHTYNPRAAVRLMALIHEEFPSCGVEISHNGGLCAFYTETGGLLVGFEG